jgi:hypothetical protein
MDLILFLLLPLAVMGLVEMVLTRLTETTQDEKAKSEKYHKKVSADDIVDGAPSKRYKSRAERSTPEMGLQSSKSTVVDASEIPVFEESQHFDIAEFTDRNEMSATA